MNPSPLPAPVFTYRMSVRWRDLDAFDHVNNANYLTYLEEARVQWLRTLVQDWANQASAPVLAASQLNYRAPVGWPGDIVVTLHAERLGNTSMTLAHRIQSPDGSILHCDGSVVLVWIDRTSGKPAPLPEALRAACAVN